MNIIINKNGVRSNCAYQWLWTPACSSGLGLRSARLSALPRLIPAHFASHGFCCAKPLSGLAKRRKQPERYRQNFVWYYCSIVKEAETKNVFGSVLF